MIQKWFGAATFSNTLNIVLMSHRRQSRRWVVCWSLGFLWCSRNCGCYCCCHCKQLCNLLPQVLSVHMDAYGIIGGIGHVEDEKRNWEQIPKQPTPFFYFLKSKTNAASFFLFLRKLVRWLENSEMLYQLATLKSKTK